MVALQISGVVLGGVFLPSDAQVVAGSDGEAAAVLAFLARLSAALGESPAAGPGAGPAGRDLHHTDDRGGSSTSPGR
jgi:hypothetical protein